jgi:hypothetical protein
MVVPIFVVTMLLVAQFMATLSRKISRFLLFWMLLFRGDLLENTSHLVGCLTLIKESNELEWVSRRHFIQICKLELMRLGLREEDLYTLLLHCGYFHCSTEVATLEITEKLYLAPHELMHWHESGLLGHTKPVNQLVAYMGKPGKGLEVILDTFVEGCLCPICIVWTLLCNDAGPFGLAYILKALTHEVKQ